MCKIQLANPIEAVATRHAMQFGECFEHPHKHTHTHTQTVLHSCLNYAENVTLIIGIYGVFAALDIIDDEAELRRQCTEKFKSTLWHCSAAVAALLLLLLLSFQLASVHDGNSVRVY